MGRNCECYTCTVVEEIGEAVEVSEGRATITSGLIIEEIGEENEDNDSYMIPKDAVVRTRKIGEGTFGCVYYGEIRGSSTRDGKSMEIAIKTVKEPFCEQDVGDLLAEARVIKEFHHPNIVSFVGICDQSNPPMVLLEYMHNSDLCAYLRKSRGIVNSGEAVQYDGAKAFSIGQFQMIQFCLDVSKGMAYLEEKKFVHRDVAARNCMLNAQMTVKIGDFGLARNISATSNYRIRSRDRPLPTKWMAPECLQDRIFTVKSDMWSFGVVMWEVFSLGQAPYPGVDNADMLMCLQAQRRLDRPKSCPVKLYALMERCWFMKPEERPSFLATTQALAWYKQEFDGVLPADDLENVFSNATPAPGQARDPEPSIHEYTLRVSYA